MTQYTARLTGAVPFNLQETFECGQCFRWLPGDDGSYTGVVGGMSSPCGQTAMTCWLPAWIRLTPNSG